ncbi:hypothetical protein BCR23_05050 [Enterococcus quebecensis]|uniref:Uncharacterized protein n=2 Tax=Enterococcus quebecensis TaxID=903983 RepID=A0A1E5GUB3_9ENTE|nr:hypothetical protein BCR23_05050 [Enterococcus quebecensis]
MYYANILDFNFEGLLTSCGALISKERKKQIDSLKFKEDKKRSLIAEILILNALVCDFSFLTSDIKFLKTEYGKPYLDGSRLQFNISHSGNYVICGVSNGCLGVDIEEYGDCHKELIHYFHPEEILEYNKLNSFQQKKYFYDFWSLKESYVKYLGLGLSYNLDSFYLIKEKERYSVIREDGEETSVKLEILNIDNQYACSICYEAERVDRIEKFDRKQLKYFMDKSIL